MRRICIRLHNATPNLKRVITRNKYQETLYDAPCVFHVKGIGREMEFTNWLQDSGMGFEEVSGIFYYSNNRPV